MRISRIHRRLAALGLAFTGLFSLAATAPAAAGPSALQVTGAISLPGDNVHPEGISVDPRNGDTYVTSFTTGAVYRAAAGQTQAQVFLPAGTDGRTQAMGTDVDSKGRLWVNDRDAVTLYDTATGARLARFVTPTPGQSVLNDLDLTPDGSVYVTDSLRNLVYRVTATQVADAIAAGGPARTLDVGFDLNGLVTPQPVGAITLNGIESNDTGSFLITVDMATGDLFRLDVASGRASKVAVTGPGLASGDGLLLEKNKLWIAHFGSDSISRVRLSDDATTAVVEQQLSDPELRRPTTLVRGQGSIHVVRSQFGLSPLSLPFDVARLSGI
ncbi:SMP-30/gluconolactonase/LRE family protein [Streptomyces phyllanthi]|uniref:SMP-30/gluconolactonase/LRE family protein n=1 Tax=Streptomyces phyllanthi TaxID=1803180 RepID=UPI00188333D0|nr:SMP-30/gluconolactonase/LRE family protein [Streptomyces phyllanthi]